MKQDCKYKHLHKQKEQCERSIDDLKHEITELKHKLDSVKTELLQKMVVLLNETQRNYQAELEFERNRVQNNIAISSSVKMKNDSGRKIKKEPSAVMTKMLTHTSSTIEVDGDDVLGFLDSPSRMISDERKPLAEKQEEKEEIEERPISIVSKDKKRRNNLNLIPSSSSEDEEEGNIPQKKSRGTGR